MVVICRNKRRELPKSSRARSNITLADVICAAWARVQKAVDDAAASINFQTLLDQSADKEKMYYI